MGEYEGSELRLGYIYIYICRDASVLGIAWGREKLELAMVSDVLYTTEKRKGTRCERYHEVENVNEAGFVFPSISCIPTS